MFTGFTYPTDYFKQVRHKNTSPSSAVNRVIAAAVVNKNFRDLLLTDPGQALAQGYQGETFPLDYNERILVLSIQADTLKEFALQIISCQEDRLEGWSGEWISATQNALVHEPE